MTGIIILAAGSSSRLGRAKQLLLYTGKTLLKHAVDAAVNAGVGPVFVVTGANEKEILSQIENEQVIVVENKNRMEGMASSIKAGITALLQHYHEAENVILMVCDQPYADEHLLVSLVHTKSASGKLIAACSYNDTFGVPALFDKSFFPELMTLKGEEGGKKILLKHLSSVASIPFEAGVVDIDTMQDYEVLVSKS